MVCQLYIYCFLNELYVGSFIFKIWCIENPYKWMNMWATPFLKFNTNSIAFCFPQRTIKYDYFEKNFVFGYYWRDYTFLDNFSSSWSLSPRLFNLLIIYRSSSHPRLAHDNVREYVGIPNCLTITRTLYENRFQYADVSLTELKNENALFLATKLFIVFFLIIFNCFCEIVSDLVLCIAKFIDELKWCCSYIELVK